MVGYAFPHPSFLLFAAMPSIHAWSWSQMSRRVVAIHPCLVARATKAFMNHSCRPTCAIEFSYSGHIFVLQQPYSEINQGGGWNPKPKPRVEWNSVKNPGFSRYWADDLVSGFFIGCPGGFFLTCFHQGCKWKWWLLMTWYCRMIWLPWEEKDAGSSFFHMEYIVVLVPWTNLWLNLVSLVSILELHCRWFMPAEISIQSTKGRSQVTSQETTFGFSAKKMMSNRMLRRTLVLLVLLVLFGALFCLVKHIILVVLMKNLNTFDATYVCMFQPKQLEPWRLVICSQITWISHQNSS